MIAPHLRENNFDLLRLLAAGQVAFTHGGEHLRIEFPHGLTAVMDIFPGVPIFFVISGYLISASYVRSTSLASYAWNRVLRIYPALWLCLVISILSAFTIYPIFTRAGSEIVPWIIAQLTIAQFFNPNFLRDYGVGVLNGSLWTIPVELQFYVLLPFIYFLLKRWNWNWWVVAFVMVGLVVVNQGYMALRPNATFGVKLAGVTVIPYLYMFLMGVLLQRYQWFVTNYLSGKLHWWLIVHLLAAIVLNRSGFVVGGNYLNPLSALTLALLSISFAHTGLRRLSGLLHGNDISYGVYIYHMVVINFLVHLGYRGHVGYFAVAMVATVLIASASWRYVEAPALRLKSYSIRRESPVSPS